MFGRTIFGAVSLAALAITLTPFHQAAAQLVPVDPSNSVLIDLGAIDGGRAAPIVGGSRNGVGSGILGTMPGGPGGGSGQLLLPPPSTPSSRLLTREGRTATVRDPQSEMTPEAMPERAPRRAAAAPQPKAPAQPKMAAAPAQPKAAPAAQAKAAPALPQISLPTVPTPAAPSTATPSSGPMALNAAPTPPPDIPPMTVVGPQASLPAPAPAAAKATTAPPAANKASTPPAAKSGSPTPPPSIAAPKAPDAPSAAAPQPTAAPSNPAPAPQQQAALPPATKGPSPAPAVTADSLEIRFALGDANLTNEAKAALDKLSDGLKNNEKSRLQLLAYASEDQISPSKARRLSLSRALAVRSHLIAKGIRSTRIDVRALGDQIPGGEPNRVDLKVTDR